MKTDLSKLVPSIYSRITGIFRRFHLIIFACLAFIIVSISIALLYSSADTSGPDVKQTTGAASFDQQTIDKIRNLNQDGDSASNLPDGRISPFQ